MQGQIVRIAKVIASIELWVVICAVGVSLFTTRALPWAIGIAALFWPARWLATGHLSVRTAGDWPVILLLLIVPLNYVASPTQGETAIQLCRLLTGIALYYSIANYATDRQHMRIVLIGSVLAGLGLAIFAFISVEWLQSSKFSIIPSDIYSHFPLLVSDTINPNVMAGNLVILFPVMAAIPLFNWEKLSILTRFLSVMAAITVAGVILLTQSRGGLLATLMVLLVMIVLRWWRGWVIFGLFIILAILCIIWFGTDQGLDFAMSGTTLGSGADRLLVWSQALDIIGQSPIIGYGMGSFEFIFNTNYPEFLAKGIPHVHNLLLQVVWDMGVLGLVSWLGTWLVVCMTAWQVYKQGRKLQDGWITGIGAGLLASQIGLVVHGMLDAVTWGMVRPAPVIWVIWGMAVSTGLVYLFPFAKRSEIKSF